MNRQLLALVAFATFSAPVSAHHSFTAAYDEGKKVTVEGEVVLFMFRNPHSFLQILVKDASGGTERWQIEWGGAGQLGEQRVTRETLKPGDHVIVTADPSRTPEDHRARMRTIERPSDGWKWGGTFD